MGDDIKTLAVRLVELLRARNFTFATAESCTGGAVSQAVTSIAGCSDVMRGAVVAYHNDVKIALLGVQESTLEAFGAVSEAVVCEMVRGAACSLGADCAVATSGIAGPGGGTDDKPVGTVWTAVKIKNDVTAKLLQLQDKGRDENIKNTVVKVLEMAISKLELY
ncbi:MAG: CinA family protein [Bacteroidaceae bacterium]|nr:CinA family protein [Bacteroidaceae bacterium]